MSATTNSEFAVGDQVRVTLAQWFGRRSTITEIRGSLYVLADGRWMAASELELIERPAFALVNEKPKPAQHEFRSERTRQGKLFSGLNCLPGQQDLFNDLDGREEDDERFEEIKRDAANYVGTEISMAEFRYSFGVGERMMSRLLAEGVIEIAGSYPNNGRPCLKYRVCGNHS